MILHIIYCSNFDNSSSSFYEINTSVTWTIHKTLQVATNKVAPPNLHTPVYLWWLSHYTLLHNVVPFCKCRAIFFSPLCVLPLLSLPLCRPFCLFPSLPAYPRIHLGRIAPRLHKATFILSREPPRSRHTPRTKMPGGCEGSCALVVLNPHHVTRV